MAVDISSTEVSRPARWRRNGGGLAAVFALVTVLSACSGDPSPDPTGSAPATGNPTSAPTGTDSPNATPSATATASLEWGDYQDREGACAGVAADLVGMALLPMSLTLGADVENIHNAEDEVERIKEAAPPALTADFARLQLIVDSFGEQVARGERGGGSDTGSELGDGSAADDAAVDGAGSDDAAEGGEFDTEEFEEALEPVKTWLTENCENSNEV